MYLLKGHTDPHASVERAHWSAEKACWPACICWKGFWSAEKVYWSARICWKGILICWKGILNCMHLLKGYAALHAFAKRAYCSACICWKGIPVFCKDILICWKGILIYVLLLKGMLIGWKGILIYNAPADTAYLSTCICWKGILTYMLLLKGHTDLQYIDLLYPPTAFTFTDTTAPGIRASGTFLCGTGGTCLCRNCQHHRA